MRNYFYRQGHIRLPCFTVGFACQFLFLLAFIGYSAPVDVVEQPPLQISKVSPGVFLADFGRVAFGNLQLLPPANAKGIITVDLGEAFANGRINRHPPGSVRYAHIITHLNGSQPLIVTPPADTKNTAEPAAVLTPAAWGVLLPFRWAEIHDWPGELAPDQIRRRAAFASDWDNQSAAFHSSDETLNGIWDLCRYSIKATTFAGVYVDGDRERISYEADAYLNQLGQYYADGHVKMARDTFDRLLRLPTWPTEWAAHIIFMAHADWMQTGDTNWLTPRYAVLKSKLKLEREGADRLYLSNKQQVQHDDIVDWPSGERDGYVFKPVNTVVNAFHLRTLAMMADLAHALHQDNDAANFAARERIGRQAFQKKLFDPVRGLYRDGVDTDHVSLHANLFPLAFGLVPPKNRPHIAEWLGQRGMACSVYAAQYLLEGLFENGYTTNAIELITAPGDRSWKHMLDSGTTITWEAWDQRYKTNQDWNHAWGAAPANLLPRFVLGVQPLTPGWRRAIIRPNLGALKNADGKVPTPLGPVTVRCEQGNSFTLSLTLPPRMTAQVQLPGNERVHVFVDGKVASAHREGQVWTLDTDIVGAAIIETRTSKF